MLGALASIPLALLAVLLGPEQELAAPITGPSPSGPIIEQLIARPGGFTAISVDTRTRYDGEQVGYIATRLSSMLAPLDPTGVLLPVSIDTEAVAGFHDATGIDLLVASATGDDATGMFYLRTDDAGDTLIAPIQLSNWQTADTPFASSLQVAQDGERTLLSWIENNNLGVATLKVAAIASGQVLGPWTLDSGIIDAASMASSGGDTLVVWSSTSQSQGEQINFVRMSGGAAPPAKTVLINGASVDGPVLTATTSGAFYMVWSLNTGGELSSLEGAAISASNVLATPITIDSTDANGAYAVVYTGSDLRVVYNNDSAAKMFARTVPLSGAPTQPIETVTTLSDNDTTPSLACSGAVCAVGFSAQVAGFDYTSVATRLDATAAPLDVPPLEFFFPADAQGAPLLATDGELDQLLFLRTIARDVPHLLLRRMSNTGAFLDGAPIDLGPTWQFTAASAPDGGVLIANQAQLDDLEEGNITGELLSSSGALVDAGTWATNAEGSSEMLACASSRCGLLYLSSNEWNSTALSPSGAVLATSGNLSSLDTLIGFSASGSKFIYVTEDDGDGNVSASIGDESVFPSFGAPIGLSSGITYPALKGVQFAASGTRVAVIWARDQQCTIEGRVFDVDAGTAFGTAPLLFHGCTDDMGEQDTALSLEATSTGFRALYQEAGFVTFVDGGSAAYTNSYQRDSDSTMSSASTEQLIDARVATSSDPLTGLSIAHLSSGDIYTYARFDRTEGVDSMRAKIVGLDGGNSDTGDDAGTVDAGAQDAGSDAGTIDAGAQDAGSAASTPSGCGCSSAQSQSASIVPLAMLLIGLALLRRRRAGPSGLRDAL